MSPHFGSFGCPGNQTVPVWSKCDACAMAGSTVSVMYGFVSESVRWHSVTLSVFFGVAAAPPEVTSIDAPATAAAPATTNKPRRKRLVDCHLLTVDSWLDSLDILIVFPIPPGLETCMWQILPHYIQRRPLRKRYTRSADNITGYWDLSG